MKKKTPYLDFYKKCMETGKIPTRNGLSFGLCYYFFNDADDYNLLQMISPVEGIDSSRTYWGSGYEEKDALGQFTPMRQTIVLFMAAMNGEL